MSMPDADTRPLVAMIYNVPTPYRIDTHRRIVREIPEVRIASLFTHGKPDQPWTMRGLDEINPVDFGTGENADEAVGPAMLWRDWKKGGRIRAWLDEHRPAAVVMSGYNDATRLRLLRWYSSRRVPMFLTGDSNVRADQTAGLKRVLKRLYVGAVVRRSAGILACGAHGAAYFARYGAQPDRTFTFPVEPEYDRFERATPDRVAEALAAFKLDPARRRIVVCARLIDRKRVDLSIDALAAIASERPEWDLLIIGDGPDRSALEARVTPALASRVTFTGFLNDQDRIAALHKGSDVAMLCSDFEPWGLALIEGAIAGCALISSDVVGAAPEMIEPGVNGFTHPAGDLSAVVDALRRVTDPATLPAMKRASAARAAAWRTNCDPIKGLHAALRSVGVI